MTTKEEFKGYPIVNSQSQKAISMAGTKLQEIKCGSVKLIPLGSAENSNCQLSRQPSFLSAHQDSPVRNVDLLELGVEDSLSTTCSSEGTAAATEPKASYKEKFRKKVKATLSNVRDHEIENAVKNFQAQEEISAQQRPEREVVEMQAVAVEELEKGEQVVALDTLKIFAIRTFALLAFQSIVLAGWLGLLFSRQQLYTKIYGESELVVALSGITMFAIFALIMRASSSFQDQSSHIPLLCLQTATTAFTIGSTLPFFNVVRLDLLAFNQLTSIIGVLLYLITSGERFLNIKRAATVGIVSAFLAALGTLIWCEGTVWQALFTVILSVFCCLAWLIRFVSIADSSKRILPKPLKLKNYPLASMLLFVELIRLIFQVFVVLADKSSDKMMPHIQQSGSNTARKRMFRFVTDKLEQQNNDRQENGQAEQTQMQSHQGHQLHELQSSEVADPREEGFPATSHKHL
jgi:hypothetical protein